MHRGIHYTILLIYDKVWQTLIYSRRRMAIKSGGGGANWAGGVEIGLKSYLHF